MLIVDAHVHIHDRFRLDRLFWSTHQNLSSAAVSFQPAKGFNGILLLTESRKANCFATLTSMAKGKRVHPEAYTGRWRVSLTGEDVSLRVHHEDQGEFFVVAGRQVVTAEKLEVLALFVAKPIKDGDPIREVITQVEGLGGQPVLPWGFGKWTGRRGAVLEHLLNGAGHRMFCLGDNGGRPHFLPEPRQFRLAREAGTKILPGSDPLPFSTEESRIGSFGCYIDAEVSLSRPAGDLKRIFQTPGVVIRRYGKLETPLRFIRNQVKMQLWKRNWIAN